RGRGLAGFPRLVGATGFEPATPTPPVWCATRLRYAPNTLLGAGVGILTRTGRRARIILPKRTLSAPRGARLDHLVDRDLRRLTREAGGRGVELLEQGGEQPAHAEQLGAQAELAGGVGLRGAVAAVVAELTQTPAGPRHGVALVVQ